MRPRNRQVGKKVPPARLLVFPILNRVSHNAELCYHVSYDTNKVLEKQENAVMEQELENVSTWRGPGLGGHSTNSSFFELLSQLIHRRGDSALNKLVSFKCQSTRIRNLLLQQM